MDWLTQNWFQLLTLVCVVIGWAITYGRQKEETAQICKKVEDLEKEVEKITTTINNHNANSDIHVNARLTLLLDERFSALRSDVQRLERKIDRIDTK